jgi:hypothetical protein
LDSLYRTLIEYRNGLINWTKLHLCHWIEFSSVFFNYYYFYEELFFIRCAVRINTLEKVLDDKFEKFENCS